MGDISDRIKSLINEKAGVSKSKLGKNTRIWEDLKMDGDDAFEFLQSFMNEFKVDMSDFKYEEYFAPEGLDLVGAVIRIFKKKKKTLKSVTIGDLERAAKVGKWTEPNIPNGNIL